jgi:DNA-binding NarL/FixJ family response regulator
MEVVRSRAGTSAAAVPVPQSSRDTGGRDAGPPVIRLAVVDATRVFADVIAARLGAEQDIQVLRCTDDVTAFGELATRPAFDVVLADAGLFDPSAPPENPPGRRRPAIVLVAEPRDEPRLLPAVRAGVRGWVPRSAPMATLLLAVREAATGGTWLPPAALTHVLGELMGAGDHDDPVRTLLATLTPREREVLCCLAEGLGRPAVAARLRMSTNTLRTHVQSILAKLEVNSSLAAVALLRSAGVPR